MTQELKDAKTSRTQNKEYRSQESESRRGVRIKAEYQRQKLAQLTSEEKRDSTRQ